MDRRRAIAMLPETYAEALRLNDAGRADLIPERLEVTEEAVGPLLRLARAKLDRLTDYTELPDCGWGEMQPRVAYAEFDERRIACSVVGDGPHELLVVGSFVSHQDLFLAHPAVRAWLSDISRYARVVSYDKLGTGLSDPVTQLPTLQDRLGEIEAVVAATGLQRPVLLGLSEGASAAIAFSVLRPDTVTSLVLVAPGVGAGEQIDIRHSPDLARATSEYFQALPESVRPSREAIDRVARFFEAIRDRWGEGVALEMLMPSLGSREQLALLERSAASPSMAVLTAEAAFSLDALHFAQQVRVPTLVIHAQDDIIPIEGARGVAHLIPGARLVELDGRDHVSWVTEPSAAKVALRELELFVTGHASTPRVDRTLATVAFVDLVGSTRRAAELGDHRWRSLLERFYDDAVRVVAQHTGTVVKTLGDGLLATFTAPATAVHCADRLRDVAAQLDLEIRAGVHTGEIEHVGDDVAGLAVHLAARLVDLAGPSEVLVSRTVRDLVIGSGLAFMSRGDHRLDGIPGGWEVLALVDPAASQPVPALDPTLHQHEQGGSLANRARAPW